MGNMQFDTEPYEAKCRGGEIALFTLYQQLEEMHVQQDMQIDPQVEARLNKAILQVKNAMRDTLTSQRSSMHQLSDDQALAVVKVIESRVRKNILNGLSTPTDSVAVAKCEEQGPIKASRECDEKPSYSKR